MPRVLGGFSGGGRFLMSEVSLQQQRPQRVLRVVWRQTPAAAGAATHLGTVHQPKKCKWDDRPLKTSTDQSFFLLDRMANISNGIASNSRFKLFSVPHASSAQPP